MKNFLNRLFNRQDPWGKRDAWVLGGGLAVFAAISIGNISRWSVWFDEAYGLYLIRFGFADVAKYTAADVHPPLYYWTLKVWQMVFGNSELALRSLSLVMIMIAIVFVYLLVRRAFGLRAGALVMALLALSPMMIRYSEEARMYGMAMAIVTAATYVLVRATEKPTKKKWVIYGILVSLGMWTHYYTAIMWLSHWVWRYLTVRKGAMRQTARAFWTKPWVLSHVLAIGLFLPWLPLMIKQMANVQGGGFWIRPITATTPFNFLTNIMMYRENHEVQSWLAVLMLAVMAIVIVSIVATAKRLRGEQAVAYRLFMVMAFVPMLLLLILSLPPLRPSFVDRYLLPSIPFWFALIGIALSVQLKNRRATIVIPAMGAVLAALVLGIIHVYTIGNYNKNANDPLPIRPTVRAMQAEAPGVPIVASSCWRFYEMHYYDSPQNPVYFEATDNLTWGSYDMLRYDSYRKIYDTPAFAREHAGVIWYVGDWKAGDPVLPKSGDWEIIREVKLDTVADNVSTIHAVELRLR